MRSASPTCRFPVGDAAALLLLALFMLIVISVPKFDLAGVLAFGAVPLFAVSACRIPLRPMMQRLLAASPFILFMAAGNLFLDRTPAFSAGSFLVTGGMLSATVIAIKTLVTLTTLLSFMYAMPFHRFGMALRSLGVPEVFVTQLLLVYRYSFLLSEEASLMQKARELRSFNGKGKGALVTAKLIGALLLRTTARAERIYMAMSARGFRTALADKPPVRLTARDLAVTAAITGLFLLVRAVF